MDVMIHKNGEMYVAVYGLWYRVIALFINDDDTNTFLEKHADCGVIAQNGKVSIVAHLADYGIQNKLM